jgi:hypothetical protein
MDGQAMETPRPAMMKRGLILSLPDPRGTHAGIVVFRLKDQRWATLKGPLDRLLARQEGTPRKTRAG